MSDKAGPLSGEALNPVIEEEIAWAVRTVEEMFAELYASGYPVGAKPLTQAQIYSNLVMLMQSGDPAYWQSSEAQKQLDTLAGKFGAPPALRGPMQNQGMM